MSIEYKEIKRVTNNHGVYVSIELHESGMKKAYRQKTLQFTSEAQVKAQLTTRCLKIAAHISDELSVLEELSVTLDRIDVEKLLKEKGIIEQTERFEDLAIKAVEK